MSVPEPGIPVLDSGRGGSALPGASFLGRALAHPLLGSRVRLLSSFLLGQGLVQVIALVTGFLLLRWLTVEDYAKFSLAFSFQATLSILADLGISDSIVNLVGTRGHEPHTIGKYVAASRWLRNRLFFLVLPAGALGFHLFAHRHGWGVREEAVLFFPMAACLLLQAKSAWYTAPLLIHKRIATTYRIASGAGLFRLTAAFALHLASLLSATTVYLINTVTVALVANFSRCSARRLIEEPEFPSRETRRELFRYILPLAPGIIFFAFIGQISVFFASCFGSTDSLAQVGALGRLGQLFTALGALSGAVVIPHFARLPETHLAARYAATLLIGFFCAGCLVAAVWFFPGPITLLLGSTYGHLHREAFCTVLASSIGFLGALMYGIAMARQWIFWWASALSIGLTLSAQAVFLYFYTIDTTLAAILLSVVTHSASLAAQVVIAGRGLRLGKAGHGLHKREPMFRSAKLALRALLRGRGLYFFTKGSLPSGVDWLVDIQKQPGTDWKAPVFFDVGANIGQTVLEMHAACPAARIFAFEPFASPFGELRQTVAAVPGARAFPIALGAQAGTMEVSAQAASVFNSLVASARLATGPREEITINTLDHFCVRETVDSIDVLKTDTEGYDLEVLRGAAGLLSSGRVRFVYTEVTFNPDNRQNSHFAPIYEYLAGKGFRLLGLYEQYTMQHFPHPGHFCNALFMRQSAGEKQP